MHVNSKADYYKQFNNLILLKFGLTFKNEYLVFLPDIVKHAYSYLS